MTPRSLPQVEVTSGMIDEVWLSFMLYWCYGSLWATLHGKTLEYIKREKPRICLDYIIMDYAWISFEILYLIILLYFI